MMKPNIPTPKVELYTCGRCGTQLPSTQFAPTRSPFFRGHIPYCNACVNAYLRKHQYSWESLNKLCQWADIPWIVKEWERIVDQNSQDEAWAIYSTIFASQAYDTLGWDDYNKQYLALKQAGQMDEEIPLLHDQHIRELQQVWGANYCEEELYYLEDLYKGLLATQNVSGALQDDQAHKICKLSLEIDARIRAGDKDVDKFLSSYDKLVKTAEFTPKNTKNANDFDSFAELSVWLEKRGRQNRFYDGAVRDVIDETLRNIETWNQRLYINEGGIGEAITERIRGLQSANALEAQSSVYDIQSEFNPDEYDNGGYVLDGEDEEFIIDLKENT